MFGIGFGELIVIFVVALLVVGPERMPELARKLGTTIRDLRRMYDNMRAELGPDFDEIEEGIRTLRSLDPRRELDTYGRKLIGDLARDVGPEAEALLNKSPQEIGGSIKQAITSPLLTATTEASAALSVAPVEPAVSTSAAPDVDIAPTESPSFSVAYPAEQMVVVAPADAPMAAKPRRRTKMYTLPAAEASDTVLPATGVVPELAAQPEQPPAEAKPRRRRKAQVYTEPVEPVLAPEPKQHPAATVMQLSHDLLSDTLLDQPLKEALLDASQNGHGPH